MNSFIGFSYSTISFPLFSWLIMLFQKFRYSHSFVAFYHQEFSTWYVVDATAAGVRVRTLDHFQSENKIVKKFPLHHSAEENTRLLKWGLEKVGQKYPKIEIVGNLIQIMAHYLLGKTIKNPFGRGSNKPRCNELVALVAKDFLNKEIEYDLDSIDLLWLDDWLSSFLEAAPDA